MNARTTSEAAGTDPAAPVRPSAAGFTLLELLITITMLSITLGIGVQGYRSFSEASIVDRATRAIMGDVALTRSYAIQRQAAVTLQADEAARAYVVRSGGDEIFRRSFAADTDLPLTLLDVGTDGDELTFNSRGMHTESGVVSIDLARNDRSSRIRVSVLGRTKLAGTP